MLGCQEEIIWTIINILNFTVTLTLNAVIQFFSQDTLASWHHHTKFGTVQNRSGKCLTEEPQILNQWTEYCSELYNYKTNGDPSILNCPQTDTEDDHPILREKWRLQYNH